MNYFKESTHIRLNVVKMTDMTNEEFAKDRGKDFPELEIVKDGFKIEYSDGYVSWCPKDVADKCSIPLGSMPFSVALYLCEFCELKVARAKWENGRYIVWSCVSKDGTTYEPQIVYHEPDANFGNDTMNVNWSASQEDMLAQNWCIVE